MFQGFAELGDTIPVVVLVRNSSQTPVNLDALPTFRVYGPDGHVSGQTGSAGYFDSGNVTDATNASPIVVTSAGHGLATGDRVTVAGVLGNTAANGTFAVTRVSDDTFSLDGSSGDGAYDSGGVWNLTGLYYAEIVASGANGYEAGAGYSVLFEGLISSVSWADTRSFGVT
jgi:hypothetical protein